MEYRNSYFCLLALCYSYWLKILIQWTILDSLPAPLVWMVTHDLSPDKLFFSRPRLEPGGGEGWGTPLYKLYSYVPPHRVGFLHRFGLKAGIHFFGLEWGVVFEGTTRVYERIYRYNPKWVRKEEKHANSKWIWRIYWLRSSLSNDNMKSEIGYGKKDFLVWNRVRIWRTGRHTPNKNSEEYPPPGG